MTRTRSGKGYFLPLHPLGEVPIDAKHVIAISPTRSGARVFLSDGTIFHARGTPDSIYNGIRLSLLETRK